MREVGRSGRWGNRLLQTGLFLVVWAAAGVAARLAVPPGESTAPIWPAAGVAVLWFLVRQASWRSTDVLLLAAAAFLVNDLTGAPPDLALVLAATNVVQTLVAVGLLRRWCPDLWGCGGDRGFDSVRTVAHGFAALAIAMAVGAVLGTLATVALGDPFEATTALLWFTRNLSGALVVAPLGLLAWRQVSLPRPRPTVFGGPAGALEFVAACVFTVTLYGVGLGVTEVPLTYVLLVATVWIGVRFRPLATALHSSLAGLGVVVLTLTGWGRFAGVADRQLEMGLAQTYVVTVLFLGLVLSTRREETRLLETGLRDAEQHAHYQVDLLDAVINSMTEGVAVVDQHDRVLIRNSAADRLGYVSSRDASEPGPGFEVFHTDGSPVTPALRPSQRALRGEVVEDEELILASDGSGPVLAVTAVPLKDSGGVADARALLMFRDFTEAYSRRAELATFAGTVAHDLRNPLSAVEGWTEMLEDQVSAGELDPALVDRFIQQLRLATGRMHCLIDDLLDHATSGNRQLELEKVDLQEIVHAIAQSRGVTSMVDCERLPWVYADRVLVSQVLDNLIGNALKYVAPGVVPLVVVEGTASETGWATITVTDNGIGLPAGEQERIFEEFHRAHGARYDGTGLGLAIVRRIVNRHGGTITARNRDDGAGSVFELTLPAYV
ncbi:MAG: ATP-binding protein [Nocardioides sp.]